jgi:two-component system, OmpR family, sensor histidine kinase KdpD
MATIVFMDRLGHLFVRSRRGALVVTLLALAGSTIVIALLENIVQVPNAASVYLLAVLTAGMLGGTLPAVATAVASFFLYDFFFTQPYLTLTIADASEWLNLLLFLAVAIAIGRLAALQAQRATEAAARAREAQALFAVSRSLATTDDLPTAAATVLRQLAESGTMDRLWLGLGPSPAEEQVVADTGSGSPLPIPKWQVVLQRTPGDEPAHWARTHVGIRPSGRRSGDGTTVHRIRVEVPGEVVGSLWALRTAGRPEPDLAETRILSAAADQLGQAVRRERLVREGLEAEVARRSEALMGALLDSVSHDLRTPLATIRAAAGSMLDEAVAWSPDERMSALRSIDSEAERMNRLVRNLLDLSRIEGGALRPELEPHDLDDLVHRVVQRVPTSDKLVQLDIPPDLPPLVVDDTYLDEVLTNLVENGVRYGGSVIRIAARELTDGPAPAVEVTVEDNGAGASDADIARLFDKFYRVRRPGQGSRPGMGIGLTVAQGLARAMRGDVTAERSALGGLAFKVRLPAVHLPPEPGDGAVTA